MLFGFNHGYDGKHLGLIIVFYLVKIQGDGRKFPDCCKSYFGSQMPTQSLNEVHILPIYRQYLQQKVIFFIYFCL